MTLPGDRFNGIIDIWNSQDTFGHFPRKNDADPFTLSAAYGGQYFAITGWSGGSFDGHPKALPPCVYRAVAPLEGRSHDHVGGAEYLQGARNRGGPNPPGDSPRVARLTPLDASPARRDNAPRQFHHRARP